MTARRKTYHKGSELTEKIIDDLLGSTTDYGDLFFGIMWKRTVMYGTSGRGGTPCELLYRKMIRRFREDAIVKTIGNAVPFRELSGEQQKRINTAVVKELKTTKIVSISKNEYTALFNAGKV